MTQMTRIIGFVDGYMELADAGKPSFTAQQAEALTASFVRHDVPGVIAPEEMRDRPGHFYPVIGIDAKVETRFGINASNDELAKSLANVFAIPELAGLCFNGNFTVVTDGYPLPSVQWIGVTKSRVSVSQASITWDHEQCLIEPQV